ncbi:hypothetical protein [Peptostreptococcus porci]|uniref:hypothetical protein n=1 Tax=Peptostreptococcus porci TaxID=2652282 RepID=UPI002A7F0D93|nr:hypothetical protein [Peptostreptococcus porci]MDY4128680.1 hypothetical protein [Peptostreptococcus porci]
MIENLRNALEYLVDLGRDQDKVIRVNGENYSTCKLERIDDNVSIRSLEINTLSGLVDYMKSNVDKEYRDNLLVIVNSPTRVTLKKEINSDGDRPQIMEVSAIVPHIRYADYYETETFNILLQSAFIDGEHKDILLKVVGNIKEEVIKNVGDDGISQAATIKTGIATVSDVKVPNPVSLRPRRTFNEIEQPESKFIFRMKDGPKCALFEADGGAWRNEAMNNIKKYLDKELEGIEGVTIIS